MRRRDIVLLAAAALTAPRLAGAQQAERMRRIGYFSADTASPDNWFEAQQMRALVEGLREFGWFDGRNMSLEHRFSAMGRARIQANAKELIALSPDVIVSVGGLQLAALLAETRTIPIVFTNVSDPVASGFVESLGHPGGNATGVGVNEAPIAGKWLELLKEIAPGITRVLVLAAAGSRPQQVLADTLAAASPSLGLPLVAAFLNEAGDYEREIGAFAREPGGGLVALSNPILAGNYARVHALAAQYRLPAMYSYPIYARTGGLLSYGPDNVALIHDVARHVDKILRGAKPGDLPVQQPTRFVLAVNLKTAKAIGLTVPPSILARADEVIE